MAFAFLSLYVIVAYCVALQRSFCLQTQIISPTFVVDFSPALLWAKKRGEIDRDSGDAMSDYRSDVHVGSNQCKLEAASLTHPQSCVCCANKQHGPTPVRWSLHYIVSIYYDLSFFKAPKISCLKFQESGAEKGVHFTVFKFWEK